MLLGLGGVANALEYEIDEEYTSIASVGNNKFILVNKTESKAVYNHDAQNLSYGSFSDAISPSNQSCYFVLESLSENADESVRSCYLLRAVTSTGANVSFWGKPAVYLNSGDGFNGCFVLDNGDRLGTDIKYGAVWEVEYVDGQGFTLKNKAKGGYFAGPSSRPEGSTPVYWSFCTLKEKAVEDTEDPGIKECPSGWTSLITNGTLTGTETDSYKLKINNGTDADVEISDNAGRMNGRGLKITSSSSASNNWTTQFFLAFDNALPAGTKMHIEFDYKADKAGTVTTQVHREPGSYISNNSCGDINFGLSWQHFEKDFTILEDGVKSIAFNMNENQTEAINFHFDNFVLWYRANAITKGVYDATDAQELDFNNFVSLGGNWDSETNTFTGNCGFQWAGDGLDMNNYKYIVVTVAKNLCTGGYKAHIKDKNNKEIVGDDYGADFMNMWFGEWNHHNCMTIDVEKLRVSKEFDLHHISELMIEGGDGVILANAYLTNQKPNNDKNWNGEDAGDFSVSSGIAVDKFGTICLNFPAAVAGALIYQISGKTASSISLSQYTGLLEAGKPYFFKTIAANNGNAPAAVRFYKATSATVASEGTNNGLVGTFTDITAPQGTDYYVLSSNQLWQVDSDVTVGANKAYVDVSQITNSSSAKGRIELFFNGADDTTGIESMNAIETLTSGKIYDLSGRVVTAPTKGMYIINGKKVLVK